MVDYVSGGDLSNNDSIAHFALFTYCDPITFEKAVTDEKWQKAMNDEIQINWEKMIFGSCHIFQRAKNSVKWVYKTNLNKDGGIDKYKA